MAAVRRCPALRFFATIGSSEALSRPTGTSMEGGVIFKRDLRVRRAGLVLAMNILSELGEGVRVKVAREMIWNAGNLECRADSLLKHKRNHWGQLSRWYFDEPRPGAGHEAMPSPPVPSRQ